MSLIFDLERCCNAIMMMTPPAFQELPLHASLILPNLTASKQELDFGTCLVGQPKQLTFLLRNRTLSASHWNGVSAAVTTTCENDTFILQPTSGMLEAHIAHVTKSDVLITATFLAR